MSRKIPDTKIVGTRLPTELEQRAQAVAKELSRRASGVPITLSAAMALIVAKGLDTIERELRLVAKSSKSTAA